MTPELKSQQSKRFITPEQWNTEFTHQPFFKDLNALFPLRDFQRYPSVTDLNTWGETFSLPHYRFIEDAESQQHNPQDLYYEQFIYEKQLIPTRSDNWHDLFNAMIWCLFPQSKSYLNQIHIDEIKQHGLNPRSPVRNRVTHFDECGGILVYQDEGHLELLHNHQWQKSFVEKRSLWQTETRLFIFGHANYEMLLSPYIGLTGKYLPLKVNQSFWQMSLAEQYSWLDSALLQELQKPEVFAQKGHLKPIPLLGIPDWWSQQDQEFYANSDYFRPLRGL